MKLFRWLALSLLISLVPQETHTSPPVTCNSWAFKQNANYGSIFGCVAGLMLPLIIANKKAHKITKDQIDNGLYTKLLVLGRLLVIPGAIIGTKITEWLLSTIYC